uniref:Calcineurin-like phosphoesterase domain-containing protein n=1 Tax=Meleagris gallopavo TaxID=9103 RepID=A0A803YFU2_MELGA
MKVAVAGCCHGALDKMYETLELLQRRHNVRPDLLLCCGDFQAVRNEADLRCMAVPAKYRHMQTFYRSTTTVCNNLQDVQISGSKNVLSYIRD